MRFWFKPSDIVLISYWLFIFLITIIYRNDIIHPRFVAGLSFSMFCLFFSVAMITHNRMLWVENLVRIIVITSTMTIAFTVLAELVNVVNPVSREKELINIDRTIFLGVNPVEWLSNYQNPLLTEILQFVYATFYFLPLIPALYLYDKKEHEKLEIYIFSIVLGFCLTYLGYMSVPARSPYLIASDGRGLITFPAPLEGIYITDWLRTTIHSLEEIKWDCFPSGHVALSFITLLSAYLYARKTFYFLLPVVSALVFSTVYLRYHYVIDVIAGLALGCFVVYVCPKIQHFYNERKTKYNELHYDSKLRKSRI